MVLVKIFKRRRMVVVSAVVLIRWDNFWLGFFGGIRRKAGLGAL